jgi:MATE family multidrug resistance protein
MLLDLLFVLQFKWGVAGVAAASVLSEYLALCTGLYITRHSLRGIGAAVDYRGVFDMEKLKALLHVNLNIFIRTMCLVFAFAYFTAQGTKLGETILAANAVLMQLQNILAYGLDGFAHAAEALAGGAYGARNRTAFRSAVFYTSVWALALAGVYTLVYILFGENIVSILTGIDSVRASAADYMIWILVSPVISVWGFQLDGIFIGATRTVEMRNAMLLSLTVYLIAVWLIVPVWGNHGLWFCLMLFMVSRAVTLGIRLPGIEKSMA